MPRDPKLADNLADRLVLNPKRPPDPTYRFHRHHPRPRSPKHTRGSIRRFGAGSLFDADHPRSRVTLPRCFPHQHDAHTENIFLGHYVTTHITAARRPSILYMIRVIVIDKVQCAPFSELLN